MMLIDDIINERDLKIFDHHLKETIVFRIHENYLDYIYDEIDIALKHSTSEQKIGQLEGVTFPSLLPYENIVIHFNDHILWCVDITEVSIDQTGTNQYAISLVRLRKDHFFSNANNVLFDKDDSGNVVANGKWGQINLETGKPPEDDPDADYLPILTLLYGDIITLKRLLEFLTCKNIREREVDPDLKIQKKRKKKGKKPLKSFKVLELANVTIQSSSKPNQSLWSNRVHLCRGHIAEYGPKYGKGKLFGKIEGRFWIPPHVRGNKKEGIVEKDYLITESKSPIET